MLDDHERRALQRLERQLKADDPGFPRSFDAHVQRMDRRHFGAAAVIAVLGAVALGVLLLLGGSLIAALALVTVTSVLWSAWRHSDGTSRPPR